jgi:hypothetical protein
MTDTHCDTPAAAGAGVSALTTRVIPDRRTRRRVGYGTGGVDGVNRLLLGVIGLALAAAGALVLLLAGGAISWAQTPASIWRSAARDATDSPSLSAAIASAGCLVLALAALAWARSQLRPVGDGPRLGTLRLGSRDRGRTTVPASAVAEAAGRDFGELFGVLSAEVRLLAVHPRPRAVVTLELGLDADPSVALAEASRPLARLAGALGATTVDSEFRIRFGRDLRSARGGSRVR